MNTLISGKANVSALSNYVTSADSSGYALSSAIPDVSSFITNSTNSLANYDTSSTVDSKITNAGVGSYWTKDTTTDELSYDGNIEITPTPGSGEVKYGVQAETRRFGKEKRENIFERAGRPQLLVTRVTLR